jgi:hypothetical protein
MALGVIGMNGVGLIAPVTTISVIETKHDHTCDVVVNDVDVMFAHQVNYNNSIELYNKEYNSLEELYNCSFGLSDKMDLRDIRDSKPPDLYALTSNNALAKQGYIHIRFLSGGSGGMPYTYTWLSKSLNKTVALPTSIRAISYKENRS